jgi:hypothetical protein
MNAMNLAPFPAVWPRIARHMSEMLLPHEIDKIADACLDGSALVFANEEGVLILTLQVHEGEFELLVWAAVATGEHVLERYLPFVEGVAKELGAHRIAFQPRRHGWARRLRGSGSEWTLRHDGFYVREVEHGR